MLLRFWNQPSDCPPKTRQHPLGPVTLQVAHAEGSCCHGSQDCKQRDMCRSSRFFTFILQVLWYWRPTVTVEASLYVEPTEALHRLRFLYTAQSGMSTPTLYIRKLCLYIYIYILHISENTSRGGWGYKSSLHPSNSQVEEVLGKQPSLYVSQL